MRITYRYEGGPLDGRSSYHKEMPDDPSVPFLCRLITTPGKGEELKVLGGDLEACGLYHLEKRPIKYPFAMSEEVKKQAMSEEWVAVHHPGEQDRDWHPLEPKPPEPVPEKPEKPKKEAKPLPGNHPAVLRLKAHEEAIREVLERRKNEQG